MLYLVIAYSIFVIWTIIELISAPKGYEDSEGFHYGTPPDRQDGYSKTVNF